MAKQHPADRETTDAMEQEERLARRSRPCHIVTLVLCAITITVFGIWLCLAPKTSFSEWENRTLTEAPAFSFSSLFSGTLTDQIADFCADQFPMRTCWVEAKARLELLLGRFENNNVLAGKNGYLIPRQEYSGSEHEILKANLLAASDLSQALETAGIPFFTAIVPRSIDVNRSQLPDAYDPVNADIVWNWLATAETSSGLASIDLLTPLRDAASHGEEVWYRTDHHWTTLGAYYAYVSLSRVLGYQPYSLSAFSQETVSNDFYGTSFSSSGMYWYREDSLTLFRYPGDDRLITIIGESNPTVMDGMYDRSALETRDQYRIFLGGINGMIRVSDPDAGDKPTLLMIKDSYAQSIAPFLARHYQLILVDTRSCRQSVYALAKEENVDAVLLLYGIDTLATGNSLSVLRMGLPQS